MYYDELTIKEYLERLGSSDPVPGGGGTAALAAALAANLGIMTSEITKKGLKESDCDEMTAILSKTRASSDELTVLISRDPEAYERLRQVFRKDASPEEKEEALLYAASVPDKICSLCRSLMEDLAFYAEKGSLSVRSDAACGASLCLGAARCAAWNVFANTRYLKDRKMAAEIEERIETLVSEVEEKELQIREHVREDLKR